MRYPPAASEPAGEWGSGCVMVVGNLSVPGHSTNLDNIVG